MTNNEITTNSFDMAVTTKTFDPSEFTGKQNIQGLIESLKPIYIYIYIYIEREREKQKNHS